MSLGVAFSVVLRDPATHRSDFYTFWDSGHWLRAGLDPYTGGPLREGAGYNLNPPIAFLLFVPLSWLPLVPAYVIWTTVTVIACVASAWVVAREIAPDGAVEIAAAVLISQATFLALQLGQPVGILMGMLTAAWVADRRGSLFVAGVLLGATMALKLFLGLFLLYAVWRRSARLVVGILSGFAAVVVIGLLPAGVAGYESWWFVLGRVTWAAHLVNGSLLGFLTRILTTPPPGLTVTPLLVRPDLLRPLWLAAIAAMAGIAAWRAARTNDLNRVWLMTLAASLLWSPLGWILLRSAPCRPACRGRGRRVSLGEDAGWPRVRVLPGLVHLDGLLSAGQTGDHHARLRLPLGSAFMVCRRRAAGARQRTPETLTARHIRPRSDSADMSATNIWS